MQQEKRQERIAVEIEAATIERKRVQKQPLKIALDLDIENPNKLSAADKLQIITQYRTCPLKRVEFIQWLADMGVNVSISQLHDWEKKYRSLGISGLRDKRCSNNNKIDTSLVQATLIAHSAAIHDTNLYAIFSRRAKRDGSYLPSETGFVKAKRRLLASNRAVKLLHERGQDVLMSNISTSRRRDVRYANQEWQVDASPLDLMCLDAQYITSAHKRWEEGIRYVDYLQSQGKAVEWGEEMDEIRIIYEPTRLTAIAVQDVYSGKRVWHLASSANALEDAKLLRKALLEMGKPAIIRGDNGKDYLSNHFQDAVRNLGILYHRAPPYKGKAKGAVERGFKTIMHGGLEQIAGFIGHKVADRQLIENHATTKSERLSGVKTHLENLPTRDEAQAVLDALIQAADEKHGWSAKWEQDDATFIDADTINVAIGQRNVRTVGREGIRIDGDTYTSPELWQWQNQRVLVADDIDDIAHKYVLDEAGALLCEAYSERVVALEVHEYKSAEKAQTKRAKALIKQAKQVAKEDNDMAMQELIQRAKASSARRERAIKHKRAPGAKADVAAHDKHSNQRKALDAYTEMLKAI